jgi:rubrerythrin
VVLSVAIDEMRHLRWVNEILRELGEPVELGRFTSFEDFDGNQRTLAHEYSLEPLSAQRLNWFIEVESPSQAISVSREPGTIDGLYTRLLLSISQGSEFSEIEKARLEHLLKLVIDEGQDHFERFNRVKTLLEGMTEADYLLLPSKPAPLPADHPAKMYEQVADQCYALVVLTLRYVFETGGPRIGEMLDAARHAMYALDDAARAVTRAKGAPLFTLPAAPPLVRIVEVLGVETPEDQVFEATMALPFALRIAPDVQGIVDMVHDADPGLSDALTARYDKLIEAMNAAQ